jgi:hypothetical protein
MEQLRNEKFDIGITEYFDYCALGLFTRIGLDNFVAVYISPLTQIAAGSYGLGAVTSFVPGGFFVSVKFFKLKFQKFRRPQFRRLTLLKDCRILLGIWSHRVWFFRTCSRTITIDSDLCWDRILTSM